MVVVLYGCVLTLVNAAIAAVATLVVVGHFSFDVWLVVLIVINLYGAFVVRMNASYNHRRR